MITDSKKMKAATLFMRSWDLEAFARLAFVFNLKQKKNVMKEIQVFSTA